MSDGELDVCLARTALGDADALHELYNELGSAVFAVARAITGDRQLAEDVLQDVFIRVFMSARTYRPGSMPRAWIFRIARNLSISVLRKRRWEMPLSDPVTPPSGADAGAEGVADALELQSALTCLTPTEREIVLLSVLGELPNREVARVMGIPQGSVSWRYRTAMDKLKEHLTGFSFSEGGG